MFYYKAFGLHIRSEIELFQLHKEAPCKEDVSIIKGAVPEKLENAYLNRLWIEGNKDEILFRVKGTAAYYIKSGKEITVEVVPNIPEEQKPMVQVYLMGTAMGALLIQKGILPLHGSCVWKEEMPAIAFTGDSGVGKSTIASYFQKNGWSMLSDDVTPLQIENGRTAVYPSFPQQKLWEDALTAGDLSEGNYALLWKEESHRKFAVNSEDYFHDRKEILQAVFQVIVRDQENVTCREIKGVEKAILLREHTYRKFLYAGKEEQQNHFRRCAKMAEELDMYQIFRPLEKRSEKEILKLVEEILESKKG